MRQAAEQEREEWIERTDFVAPSVEILTTLFADDRDLAKRLASLGSVVCGLHQNSTNRHVTLTLLQGNPAVCTIDFIRPSLKTGFWLKAEGEYSVVGEIHYTTPWNGKTTVLAPYRRGSISEQATTMQVPVAFEESVRCSKAACENAGLAPGHETIQRRN